LAETNQKIKKEATMLKNRYLIIQEKLRKLQTLGCNFPTSADINRYLKRNKSYQKDNFVICVINELNEVLYNINNKKEEDYD
jgi:hypothetical protein